MNAEGRTGVVISTSRRFVQILTQERSVVLVKLPTSFPKLTVGDRVSYADNESDLSLLKLQKRKNCLSRTYSRKSLNIAANIDLLLVVTAIPPLFNTDFVDRILTVASCSDIPCALVINKTDLGVEAAANHIQTYQNLDLRIIQSCAIRDSGLKELIQILDNPELSTVVLAGISGVGKSTILNGLIPEAEQTTSSVSRKTGLGRQTTSMSEGYLYNRPDQPDLLIIDLPGIQSFGMSNLNPVEVAESFPEFLERRHHCEYLDCQHTMEPKCAIKNGVEQGDIALSRYESYLNMLTEIEEAKTY